MQEILAINRRLHTSTNVVILLKVDVLNYTKYLLGGIIHEN